VAHRKLEKVKNYEQLVRENYRPKIEPKSQDDDDEDSEAGVTHRKIKRYRYLNGVNYG
jgi:hypothetical protein